MSLTFSFPFVNTPAFYTGTTLSTLVPDVFPVAINGRPYLIDQKSGQFSRQFEPRVRDSVDQSTAPGEAAINPGGLWRRGEVSWHHGAGQKYADVAESKDYRFYKSKGVNPWTRGQLTLLNATLLSKSSAATSSHMVVENGRVYASLNGDVFYSTNPFSTSATWTACTGEPGGSCQAMATDGNDVYLAFPSDGVRTIDTSVNIGVISGTKYVNSNDNYYMLGFAKNFMWGAYSHKLATISSGGSKTDHIVPVDTTFHWVGVATGQNAVYAAGHSGKKSLVYKITIKADGTLDAGVVALELPTGEVATAISGYLGFVLLGTNKGVRFCSTDADSNLIAGSLIPTSGEVKKFSSNDRFSYFTWSNYDGVSTGLGRLDLSVFTSPNTPAYATDLMYTSTADTINVVVFDNKLVFTVSGVGIVAEDANNLVTTGTLETGTYRWGIPDRKFVARVDTRALPLAGSIVSYMSLDDEAFTTLGTWDSTADVENSFAGSDDKAIEAKFKFGLTRQSATVGPTLTRWTARAYAAPFRSEVFTIPVLLHDVLDVHGKEYSFDATGELAELRTLIADPRIVTLQLKNETVSVIVESLEWTPIDALDREWVWQGTAVVTMRSVQE
jgi:hypothetical protein